MNLSKRIYESTDGAICAQFGTGELGVGPCYWENEKKAAGISIWPLENPPEKIGENILDEDTCSSELEEAIRLVFTKAESVDVVIKHLQEVKQFLIDNRPPYSQA